MISGSTNSAKVVADFSAFKKLVIEKEFVELRNRFVLFAVTKLVKYTPVDYGYAQSNWKVSSRENTRKPPKKIRNKHYDNNAIRNAKSALTRMGAYEVVMIYNNTEYIGVLDEGGFDPPDPGPSKDPRPHRKGRILVSGGYSTQAPRGIMEIALQEIEMFFK